MIRRVFFQYPSTIGMPLLCPYQCSWTIAY
jgi:hypothetical protein